MVVFCERKRHTARRLERTRYAALSPKGRGIPIQSRWGYGRWGTPWKGHGTKHRGIPMERTWDQLIEVVWDGWDVDVKARLLSNQEISDWTTPKPLPTLELYPTPPS